MLPFYLTPRDLGNQIHPSYIYAGTGSGTVKSGVYVGGGWNTMNRLI